MELETGYLSSYSGHHQFIFSFQAQGRQAVRVTLYTQGDKMSLVELQCGTATYAATVSHPEFLSALGVAVGAAVPTICSSTRHVTRSSYLTSAVLVDLGLLLCLFCLEEVETETL